MSTKKKMVLVVVALCLAIVVTTTATVIVFVASNQTATARVKVTYESEDVAVTISANCYVGNTTYQFTTNDATPKSSISLSPTQETGELYQPQSVDGIAITKTDGMAVFEYIFQNDTNDVDVLISLSTLPETTGFTIKYAKSEDAPIDSADFKIVERSEIFGEEGNDFYTLNARSDSNAVMYIYIFVEISNELISAEYKGSLGWSLSRGN